MTTIAIIETIFNTILNIRTMHFSYNITSIINLSRLYAHSFMGIGIQPFEPEQLLHAP